MPWFWRHLVPTSRICTCPLNLESRRPIPRFCSRKSLMGKYRSDWLEPNDFNIMAFNLWLKNWFIMVSNHSNSPISFPLFCGTFSSAQIQLLKLPSNQKSTKICSEIPRRMQIYLMQLNNWQTCRFNNTK